MRVKFKAWALYSKTFSQVIIITLPQRGTRPDLAGNEEKQMNQLVFWSSCPQTKLGGVWLDMPCQDMM